MYKFFATISTVEFAHQKALSTRMNWLGERARATEVSQVYPWNIFQQPRDVRSEEAAVLLGSRLLDDLAELAEGTTIMGKPERKPPRFGPIASPKSGSVELRASWQLYIPPGPTAPTPCAGYNRTKIVAPVPITPIPWLRRTLEIYTSKTTSTPPFSDFSDFFEESPGFPENDIMDENKQVSRLFAGEKESTDVETLWSELRGRREPFSVLRIDLACAPREERRQQRPIIDAGNPEEVEGIFKSTGVLYEGAHVASRRSKAPRAFNIAAINATLRHERGSPGRRGVRDLDHGVIYAPSKPHKQPAEWLEVPHVPRAQNILHPWRRS